MDSAFGTLVEEARAQRPVWGGTVSSGQVIDCRSSARTPGTPHSDFSRELNRQLDGGARDPRSATSSGISHLPAFLSRRP